MFNLSDNDDLLEGAVVDRKAIEGIEKNDSVLPDIPLWLLILLAIIFAAIGAGLVKSKGASKDGENSSDKPS